MTDLIKAAAQALEALDKLSCLGNGDMHGNSTGNCIAIKAAEALRAALATQQAARPDGRLHADGYFTWARRDGYVLDTKLPCDFYLVAQPQQATEGEI